MFFFVVENNHLKKHKDNIEHDLAHYKNDRDKLKVKLIQRYLKKGSLI